VDEPSVKNENTTGVEAVTVHCCHEPSTDGSDSRERASARAATRTKARCDGGRSSDDKCEHFMSDLCELGEVVKEGKLSYGLE
jgi:hypothetical protein